MTNWLELNRARKEAGGAPPRPPALPPVPPRAPVLPPPPVPVRIQTEAIPLPPPPPPAPPPSRWVAQARELNGGGGANGAADQEIQRILALPIIPRGVPRCPDRRGYERSFLSHIAPPDFHLRDVQLDAAYTYEQYGGAFGTIGVGHGKTLIALLATKIALQRRGHYRAAIMVPPEVFSQLVNKDLPWARMRLALDGIPYWIVSGNASARLRMAQQPGTGVWIYSYSSLSTQTGFDELMAVCATMYVLDEAHNVASPDSARSRRLNTVLNEIEKALKVGRLGPNVRAKQVEVLPQSGTMTKKSVKDFAHLARRALREASPAPLSYAGIALLSSALDATVLGTGLSDLDYERMRLLRVWAEEAGWNPKEGVPEDATLTHQDMMRSAFEYRLNTAPGVVATHEASVGASLIIAWSEPPRPRTAEADHMAELMKKVVKDMVTPDGDAIDFGMHTYKWLWELTTGFYNSLVWPTAEQVQVANAGQGKPISAAESDALVAGAKAHHALLQEYHKALRQFLDRKHIPGCDTPLLVGQELTRQREGRAPRWELPKELVDAYKAQKETAFDDLPTRRSRPVRLCDYKIRAAVEWAKAHVSTGGLMWYHHPAVGEWVREYLTAEGVPHTYAPAGANDAAFKPGLVLASYAHGTGKNLQGQSHNLIIELRREAHVMEQMLGRTHRSGQAADEVYADVFVSNGFDLSLFNSILREADYAQTTLGQPQRLCYATYSPVVPSTNPRLSVKLGIMSASECSERYNIPMEQAITPPEALDWRSVFRSLDYSIDKVRIDTPA